MTILVTGAAGFLGMHVAKRLLQRGERVIGVDNMDAYYSLELKEARLHLKPYTKGGFPIAVASSLATLRT